MRFCPASDSKGPSATSIYREDPNTVPPRGGGGGGDRGGGSWGGRGGGGGYRDDDTYRRPQDVRRAPPARGPPESQPSYSYRREDRPGPGVGEAVA